MGGGILDWVLHLDKHLAGVVAQYGVMTYAILFGVLFAETGFVVTPFLPGDSLLFGAGALAAGQSASLNIWILAAVFFVAAVLGDTVNFEIGKRLGPRLFKDGKNHRFLKRENLEKTEAFFKKYGGKTIVIARFVPVVRTFAPFVAGAGQMHYGQFIRYNLIGAALWVALFLGVGYLFGNLPVVKNNFGLVVVAIVVLSLVPAVYEFIVARRDKGTAEAGQAGVAGAR